MKRFLIIVFLFPCLLLFWLWYTFVGPGYWAEYKDIKAELEKIPELEIKELGYNEDVTLQDIWAILHVKGKGDLTVYGLTRESFKEPTYVALGTIGQYDIRYTGEHFIEVRDGETGKRESIKSQVSGYAVNIIGEGEFARFFPSDLRNIQDLVVCYDEVLEAVSEWPNADNKKYLQSDTENEYNYYTIKTET